MDDEKKYPFDGDGSVGADESSDLQPTSANDAVVFEEDDAPSENTPQDGDTAEKTDDENVPADEEGSALSDGPTRDEDGEPLPKVYDESDTEPIVYDESEAETSVAEAPKLTPKHKEGMGKKKKIAIACVAFLLIAAIVLGISLPIYFANRGKIFVSSAEDFLNYDGGTYFVLDTDLTVDGDVTVGRGYNLDLNGHTLTVNGTLTFENTGEGDMYVGTLDGDSWTAQGSVTATAIVVASPAGTFRFCAPTVADSISTSSAATAIRFDSTVVSNGPIDIEAHTVVVNGSISFGEGEAAKATFTNVSSLTINAAITSAVADDPAEVYLSASTAYVNASGKLDALYLSHDSKAAVFGTVSSLVSSYGDPVEGSSNLLALLDTYSCPAVVDVDTVVLERKEGSSVSVTFTDDNGRIVYIERLSAPLDINVNPGNNALVATAAEVSGAVGYEFSVDGGEWLSAGGANEYDVTALLRSQTGAHLISARAVGNYSYDEPFDISAADEGGILYITGESVSCEYVYQITLSTPTGLNMSGNTLTFSNVSFADYYTVTVNGVDTGRHDAGDGETVSVDLSQYLNVGSNSIRVTAHSDNPDILSSDEAMTSVVVRGQLSAPSVTATYDPNTGLTTVTITEQDGAATYKVEYLLTDTQGSSHRIVTYTSALTFNISGLGVGSRITVTAEANGVYGQSSPTTITVSAAQ